MSFDSSARLTHDLAGERSIKHVGLIAEDNTVLAREHYFTMTTTRALCHCHW